MLSIEELFDLYSDTLNKCGAFLLNEDDSVIEYNIFEEFDIGVHSFFHIDSLKKLLLHGYITQDAFEKSNMVREKTLQLQNSNQWNIENVKISREWRDILYLCDEIKIAITS